MCSVLVFNNESEKLRSLLSESNHFDSVLFIFDGGRRYKVPVSSLGIRSAGDLLLPLGLGLFRSSPFWHYYLYPCCSNFNKGIDGLCGEVLRYTGFPLQEESCHVFVERSRRQLSLLYRTGSEYHLESRRLNTGLYRLHREEVSSGFLPIPWSRLNELLTLHKPSRKQARPDP